MKPFDREEARRLRATGMTVPEIVERTGWDRTAVQQAVRGVLPDHVLQEIRAQRRRETMLRLRQTPEFQGVPLPPRDRFGQWRAS